MSRGRIRWLSAGALIVLAGATAAGALAARAVVHNQEADLLEARAAEVALVLSQAVTALEGRFEALGTVVELTGGDPAAFTERATELLPTTNFEAIALVDVRGDAPVVVATAGAGLESGESLSGTKAATAQAAAAQLDFTQPFRVGGQLRLGSALGAPLVPQGYVVYAEQPVQAEPTEPRDPDDPFAQLDVVLYASSESDSEARVITTTADLPLGGDVDRRAIAIGADTWFMETAAIEPLVGEFPQRVHWLILGLGALVTVAVVFTIESLGRRHDYAMALVEERTAELVEADRLKDEFLDIAAHELRTPLTAVAGFAELLQEGDRDAETEARLIDRIHANARSMEQLTSKFLDLSRLRAGRIQVHAEPLRLEEAIRVAISHAGETLDDRAVTVDVADGLVVEADAEATDRILVNLLTNAAKFSGPGTPIVVTAEPNGREVEISVTDQGPGIPDDERERIFERFYRSGSASAGVRGTGVGLAIVAQYVGLHGGRVGVESEGGKGSRFWFTLPSSEVHPVEKL